MSFISEVNVKFGSSAFQISRDCLARLYVYLGVYISPQVWKAYFKTG